MTKRKNWGPQQKDIFTFARTGRGNARVTARAGCGKTTTMIEAANHAPERSILFCAFNTEIANELSARIENQNATARTFHSLGNGVVYKNLGKVQVDKDRGKKLAKKALGKCFPKKTPTNDIISCVKDLASKAKNIAPFCYREPNREETLADLVERFDLYPSAESAEAGWDEKMIVNATWVAMEMALVNDGSIDYDDMIFLPLANNWVRPRYDLIIVDEAQDLNYSQILLAKRLSRGRIIVVGDDRQAIYGFRGADSGSLDRLAKELKTTELKLTVTYRCPKNVVALANEIVPDFQAAPEAPEGIVDSASYERIFDLAAPGNFILSRTNAPLAKTCLQLVRMGKRAIIRGRDFGEALVRLVQRFEAPTMADLFAALKQWEQVTIESIQAEGEDADEEKMDLVVDQANTIRELAEGIATPAELVARIKNFFVADQESNATLGRAITLSTVHKAKGLETERVFVLKDSFKRRVGENKGEEANIWYVAITRPKEHLTLVSGGTK